jgi:hypothetical protein
MTRIRIKLILFIIFTFLFCLNQNLSKSVANPVPIYEAELWGLIPKEDYSCSMPNASVIIEIDATNPYGHFALEFMGNYTLYNPNDTLNLTIAAPFSSDIFGLNSTCILKMNDSKISYEVIECRWNDDSPWNDYISFASRRILVVCNITIPMNASVILDYNFKTQIKSELSDVGSVSFLYDVGTAKAWNGTITETIEFKVHGLQPDSYTERDLSPRIIEITDGKRYIWELRNEEIPYPLSIYGIYISFKGDYQYREFTISAGNYYIIFLFLGIISLIALRKRVKSINY